MFIWAFPLLYLIHDIEEIITVERFLINNSSVIPFRVTTAEFTLAFSMLWIIALIGCYQASKGRKFLGLRPITFFTFLIPGILLANGIGHLGQLIIFRDYVPGIITTFLNIFPYSFIVLRFLFSNKLLTWKRYIAFLIIGFILQTPLSFIAIYISKFILS